MMLHGNYPHLHNLSARFCPSTDIQNERIPIDIAHFEWKTEIQSMTSSSVKNMRLINFSKFTSWEEIRTFRTKCTTQDSSESEPGVDPLNLKVEGLMLLNQKINSDLENISACLKDSAYSPEMKSLQESLILLTEALSHLSVSITTVAKATQVVAQLVERSQTGTNFEDKIDSKISELPEAKLNPVRLKELEEKIPLPYKSGEEQIAESRQKLAFNIQRDFVQARIEGLGKPSELAMDDFVSACIRARSEGIDLPQLQLLLILADGSLPSEYKMTPFLAEEARIRTTWMRLVFTTLHLVDEMKKGVSVDDPKALAGIVPADPMDIFVASTVKDALDMGHDIQWLVNEQAKQGHPSSQAIKMMRQSQFIVLLTLKLAG